VSTPLEQRRAARQLLRAQRRRRRFALIDTVAGVAIAIVGFIIAPGIGIVALCAVLVLGVCGGSLFAARSRRRRTARRLPRTRVPERPLAPAANPHRRAR